MAILAYVKEIKPNQFSRKFSIVKQKEAIEKHCRDKHIAKPEYFSNINTLLAIVNKNDKVLIEDINIIKDKLIRIIFFKELLRLDAKLYSINQPELRLNKLDLHTENSIELLNLYEKYKINNRLLSGKLKKRHRTK